MEERRPAEVFPPGDFVKEELEERGWSQNDLAVIVGRSPKEISDIVLGKRPVSPEIARELSAAFGTSAELWLNLESTYRLWRHASANEAIARRAALYGFAPIGEMVRRRWVETSENVAVLEDAIKRFFEVDSLEQQPGLQFAARKSVRGISTSHMAWLYRARHLSQGVHAERFTTRSLDHGLSVLRSLMLTTAELGRVSRVLADAGVRFVVIEPLPRTRIDGAVLWLDERSPVIALSLRCDRVDHFWFTLAHELGHLKLGHGKGRNGGRIDVDIYGQEAAPPDDSVEREADRFASGFLVPADALDEFVMRAGPLYTKDKIRGFALTQSVHPGVVVGQLQRRQELPWSAFRPLLERVRHVLTPTARTDGWGHVPPAPA